MKNALCALFACVTICVSAEVIQDVELVAAIAEQGLSLEIDGTDKGKYYTVEHLFDGKRSGSAAGDPNGGKRWLAGIYRSEYEYGNASGHAVWAEVKIPEAFHEGKVLKLSKYKFVRNSYAWSYQRGPIEWRIVGIDENGNRYVVVDKELAETFWNDSKDSSEFAVERSFVASHGFRTYRIEFLNTYYSAHGIQVNTYDIGLDELVLYFDVYDADSLQTMVEQGLGGNTVEYSEGDFSFPDGAWALGSGTISAPLFVNIGNTSYKCKGHRIDKMVDDQWVLGTPVEDGANEVEYTPENETDKFRFVWLWEDMNYFVEKETTTWTKYMNSKGFTGNENVTSTYAHSGMAKNAFDGVDFDPTGGSGVRYLAWIGRGSESNPTYTQVSPPTGSMVEGDEFVCSKYRVYALNSDGNRARRHPTAWSVDVINQASDGAFIQVDSHTNYTFTCPTDAGSAGQNFEDFVFETPVPFNTFRFTFIDSLFYQQNLADGTAATTETPDTGLMEIELFGNVANPVGTLRVLSSIANAEQTGFSPEHQSTLDGSLSHELKAPKVVTTADGVSTYGLLGYRIETFNETTLLWETAEYVADTIGEYVWEANAENANKRLRFTWIYNRNDFLCKLQVKSFDSDMLGAEVSPVDENGYVARGATITLTAKPITSDLSQGDASNTNRFNSEFVRWAGDIDGLDIDVTNPSITFVLDRQRRIVPMFREDWLCYQYDKANEGGSGTEWRIKNTVWDLKVNMLANGKIELAQYAWRSGRGALDLSTKIYHYETGEVLKMTRISNGAMYNSSGANDYERIVYGPVVDLVLPRDLEYLGGASFRNKGMWNSHAHLGWYMLTNVVVDCPNLHTIDGSVFTRQFALSKVVIKAPKCISLGENWAFYGANFSETNFDDWDLTSATNVPYQWFYGGEVHETMFPKRYSNGTIRFPNARSVDAGAFGACVGIAGFEIGTTNGLLSHIDKDAFNRTCATNYVLGCTADMEVNANAFANAAAIKSVSFVNYPPKDGVTLDRILLGNSANAMAKVYVSRAKDSIWSAYTIPTEQIDDATVKAAAEELDAHGAFRNADGVWKAFIFPVSMPFDPKGTIFILR